MSGGDGRPAAMDMFDYIIVGAGSAGCVLANRLSENPAHRVLLIEAGGSDNRWDVKTPLAVSKLWPNPDVTWGFMSEPEAELNGRKLPVARGKMLGGTSSLNGMMAIRGHAADYDGWRDMGLTGWGWRDVLPWFKKLESHWRGAGLFHGGDGPLAVEQHPAPSPLMKSAMEAAHSLGYPLTSDFNGESTQGFGMPDFTIRDGRRCSAADAYLHPIKHRRNLELRTGALAEKILMQGKRVTGLRYSKGGVSHNVGVGQELILCGGAINSPQLLMLSGIGPARDLRNHGIEVLADSAGVGGNLMDHPGAGMEFDLNPELAFERELRLDRLAASGLKWITKGKGIFGAPPLAVSANIATKPQSSEGFGQVDLHLLLIPLAMESRVWFPGLAKPFGPRLGAMWSLNYPKSRGSLTLRSADPYAHPRIAFNLLSHEDDRTEMLRGYHTLRKLLAEPALAKNTGAIQRPAQDFTSDDEVMEHIRCTAGTAYHPSGTCRMGADEAAVVDGELRVCGVDGLRVADASIFPRLPGGNTNLPVIMVAERASDFIKSAR